MSEPKKLLKFFEDKGFYIVLFLCVIAIGTAAYVLFLAPTPSGVGDTVMSYSESNTPPTDDVYSNDTLDNDTSVDTFSFPKSTTAKSTTSAATTPKTTTAATAKQTTQAPKSTKKQTTASPAATTAAPTTADTFYVRPVSGEIYQHFSGDELTYDRTNGDWRTHNGIDFLCNDGDKVMAVADGTVEDIFTDDYYGTSVLLDHGNGVKSVYLGLVTEATVFEGQTISAGDYVGAVNSDVLFESALPVHFHLEMTVDGKRVDPLSLIDG